MRVIFAFLRIAFHDAAIYRIDFWARLLSTFIMMYASYSLWAILYRQNPDAFGLDLARMTTYGVLGMLLIPILEAATIAQYYVADQVREGKLELDLMKPLDFLLHMLYRSAGEFFVQLLLFGLPGIIFAYLFLGFRPPASWQAGLGFAISLALGFLIFFGVSLLMGMLAVLTLAIGSYNWAYWSLVRFTSGQFVPLWILPPALAAVVAVLPFKSIYFVPMSIYIGAQQDSLGRALLSQASWVAGLFVLGRLAWAYIQRRVVVQGG
ncbi:MAG: ABC-2 family transporter protein [Chloroflexi bacterium]|nr:ABC-2 family transporter protein [Chloroflexota bacterium]MCI0649589.1 ABC-2 family transporter protein [Chloroflexota bacterium]MCI0729335.1 ABC-2 family transporter protein [Chloroflexota bacterium]